MQSKILLLVFVFLFSGCAKQYTPCEPLVTTEVVEVKVPVMYSLTRPKRPEFTENTIIPIYLEELIAYTSQLESIIDGTKRKKGK